MTRARAIEVLQAILLEELEEKASMGEKPSLPPTVQHTTIRCPHEGQHKTDKNITLLQRPDGSLFCALHGDIPATPNR